MAVFSASGSLHSALGALCAVGVAFAPTAWAAPLSGSFSSPVGAIAIKETPDGNVTGKITDAKNPCSFAKGTVVLSGIRLDESVAERLGGEGFLSYDDLSVIEPDDLMEMGGLSAEQVDAIVAGCCTSRTGMS